MDTKVKKLIFVKYVTDLFTRSIEREQQEIKWYQDISLIVIMLAFLVLSSVFRLVSPATAHAAAADISCGSPTTGHCYALHEWDGGTNGSRTDIKVVSMACNSSCQNTGFIDNEMWLFDQQTGTCTENQWGNCWVEAGYLNDGVCGFCYFWADVRPIDGGSLNLHYINNGYTDAIYDIGYSTRFSIYKQGSGRFEVDFAVQGCSSGCSYNQSYYSVNNTMSPNAIRIGSELAGTGPNSNWSAPRADYTNNYSKGGGSTWVAQGYGNGPGNFYGGNAPPPHQAWVNNVFAGDFYTYCC